MTTLPLSADSVASSDPRDIINSSPMSRAQIIAVAITTALSALDGYDVLSVAFAAPGIVRDWGLGPGQLGILFSSGLVGMGLGSLFLAPFADSLGRRALVFISLGLMLVGMVASAFAVSLTELSLWRVITGIGIGAMVAIINPLAAEFASNRRRPMAMAFMCIGYPLGGTLGGFAAAALLQIYDWQAVFLLGAFGALVLFPIVLIWLPEPPIFLLEKRTDKSLEKINRLLNRFGHASIETLPPIDAPRNKLAYREIFEPHQRATTIQIAIANFLFVITVYYILSWMPQLVADRGFSPADATAITAIANMVGVVAAILVGIMAAKLGLRNLMVAAMIGLGIFTPLFGLTPASYPMLAFMAGLIGVCLFGGVTGLYTTIANSFEPRMRATGAGFVIGLGRGGSALAPLIAGGLFAFGMERVGVSAVLGAASLAAGLILLMSKRHTQ